MPRHARLDYPGTLHHVIIRGIEKKEIFIDDQDRERFLNKLAELVEKDGTVLCSFALIPNHVHLLLKSGQDGLVSLMRKLLTGYAIYFNRRHNRHGYLFQNRYKSIICEEEVYFKELVRYICLNPLRAGLVKSIEELEDYRWSAYGYLLGQLTPSIIKRGYVLSNFGQGGDQPLEIFRGYIVDGIKQGLRPELVGGGLVRSLGEWSRRVSVRREKEAKDERILGTVDFVKKVLKEADERVKEQIIPIDDRIKKVSEIRKKICGTEGVTEKEVTGGGRRKIVSDCRAMIAFIAVKRVGLSAAQTGRMIGITTSGVINILNRGEKLLNEKGVRSNFL